MIPPETVSQIHDAARIEEVISDFVVLKRRGSSMIGLCPFHNEKTPSFHVSVTKGIYKCFGCGKGGDSVAFIMEHEKASYPEALRYLAEKYQIGIEEEEFDPSLANQNDDRESMFILNAWAASYFSKNLAESGEGQTIGLSYFRERGFREETLTQFELGYALEERQALTKAALKEGFKEEFLIRTGLSIQPESGGESYDRFRARVIFPIHNLGGKIIGFGGRILKKVEKTAKYLNSPESEIYHKGETLYGFFHAKKAIRDLDACLLAEGYTDVISLHQSGIQNVVASSGTSLTTQQLKLISRFTQNITVLYDGDTAGVKASLRGIDMILEEGLHVRVVLFPQGHDPDSYIKSVGGAAFSAYIQAEQKDFILFKTQVLLGDAGADPIKRSAVIHDILESISKIPDSIAASLYTKECSRLLDIEEAALISELNKIRLRRQKALADAPQRNINRESSESLYSQTASNHNSLQQGGALPTGQGSVSERGSKRTSIAGQENLLASESEGGSPKQSSGRGLDDLLDTEKVSYPNDIQEREILRLLINYGNIRLESGYSAASYIFAQMEGDVQIIIRPLHEQFYMELKRQQDDMKEINPVDFIQHKNFNIRMLAIDLLSSPYSLSENWSGMHGIFVKTEEELLAAAVDNAINHLKLRRVISMIAENQQKMKTENRPERIMELQSFHNRWNETKNALSQALGVVVLK